MTVITAVGTPALLVATFGSKSLLVLAERIAIAVVLAWLTSLSLSNSAAETSHAADPGNSGPGLRTPSKPIRDLHGG
jgi:hypothetical protein